MTKINILPITFIREPLLDVNNIYINFENLDKLVSFFLKNKLALDAIKDANPVIANELLQYKAGNRLKNKKARHLYLTLENYLIRMSTRTTPFRLMTQETICAPDIEEKRKHKVYISYPNSKEVNLNRNNINTIRLKSSNLIVERDNQIFINVNNSNKLFTLHKTLFLSEILDLLGSWTDFPSLWKKISLKFPQIHKNSLIIYLSKLISFKVIDYSHNSTLTTPIIIQQKKNISLPRNIQLLIELLGKLTDTKQEYNGWHKLENLFCEDYLYEKIPLKNVVYSDEFNVWHDTKIKFKQGENYKILREFIDEKISEGNHQIEIPKNITDLMMLKDKNKLLSGDILINSNDDQTKLILDEGIGSSRCIKLLGRYLSFYPHRDQVASFLSKSLNIRNAVFAEVRMNFNDEKFQQINNSVNPYPYEINLNCLPSKSKIDLDINTLSVGVDNRGIYLWSEELNKEVVPQFTNAINGLAVDSKLYKFLYLLARVRYEDFKPVIPGYLENRIWEPRITYQNIIIRREQWKFDMQFELEAKENFMTALINWKKRLKIPSIIGVSCGEAATVYNFENKTHLRLLKKFITKNKLANITFVEIPEISEWKCRKIKQEILSFYISPSLPLLNSSAELSDYRPTSSKLFINKGMISVVLYPSFYLKNELLVITRLINKLNGKFKLFFVRYNDDDKKSLRLRFWDFSHEFLFSLAESLEQLCKKQIIDDYIFNRFKPEYGRYGGENAMAKCLLIFEKDSQLALKTLDMEADQQELAAIYSSIILLKTLGYNFKKLITLLNVESKKISKHSPIIKDIDCFLKEETKFCDECLEISSIISSFINSIYKTSDKKRGTFILSILHMHLNRFLRLSNEDEKNIYIKILEFMKIEEDKSKHGF